MNLKNNPTTAHVRELLRHADDRAGHHILWVDTDGEVRLELLAEDESPAGWTARMGSRVRLRYETLGRGMGYTGPAAARDDRWVNELHHCLTTDWSQGRKGYMDYPAYTSA